MTLSPASRAHTQPPEKCLLNSGFIHSLSNYFLNTVCVCQAPTLRTGGLCLGGP